MKTRYPGLEQGFEVSLKTWVMPAYHLTAIYKNGRQAVLMVCGTAPASSSHHLRQLSY